ncbi:MAG: PAS domain S-box protein, partial [Pseudomonadota bacterium]
MTPAERRRLAIIQDLAVRLLDAERLGDVLESGITSAIEQLGFGECVIYLWSEQRQRLEPSAGWSRTVETTDFLAGCRTIEANEGVAGRAFRTRRPELINETRNEPAYIRDRLEGRSELCVPLNHGDQCFGVIDSENLEPGHFTAEHRDLLTLVASIIAPKIHNLQTIERLERLRGALEQSRSFVREMIDTAPNVLYVLDYDQRIMIEGMDRFAAFLGHARETIEAMPEGVYSLIHPDDRDAVTQQEAELREASEGSVIAVEFRLRHADDGYRWCLVSSRIFQRRDDGSPILELGSVTDITSLKDALAREERREKRFRALFENCFDCIVLYDAQGTCRYSTPSVQRFTGYADHEIVGRNALDFVVQEDHAHSLKAWFELLQRPGGFA